MVDGAPIGSLGFSILGSDYAGCARVGLGPKWCVRGCHSTTGPLNKLQPFILTILTGFWARGAEEGSRSTQG